jgi:hypothetical protein
MLNLKKLIPAITLVLLMSILVIEYVKTKPIQEPPKLIITIGDKQLDYIVAKNKWNGGKYDREDTFKTILKKGSKSEISYIEIGNIATITFTNKFPKKFTIKDILIDENGNQSYSDKEIRNIPVELKDGKVSFKIEKHFASALSSNYIEGKTDIRGFRMIATWGENECEYAFIIRTDSF